MLARGGQVPARTTLNGEDVQPQLNNSKLMPTEMTSHPWWLRRLSSMLLLRRQLVNCLRRRRKESNHNRIYSFSDLSDPDWIARHDCNRKDICSSKGGNIVTSRKYKRMKANNINTVPINVVIPTDIIHSTSCRKVWRVEVYQQQRLLCLS